MQYSNSNMLQAANEPVSDPGVRQNRIQGLSEAALRPNKLVRWAFLVSILAIPFTKIYLPGTGDRVGVTRLVQLLIFFAVLSQPKATIRMIPVALIWLLGYCVVRLAAGFWMTPHYLGAWLPDTLHWLQFALPWAWVTFNVLQFPGLARKGLWALIGGCVVCALLHLAGIGVVEVTHGIDGRTAVFGENANVVGATYAVALIAMVGIAMSTDTPPHRKLALFPLFALVAAAMAKTGSRTAALLLAMGILVMLFQGGSIGFRTRRIATVLLVTSILAGILWQIPTVAKRFDRLDSATLQAQEGRVRMIPVLGEMFLRSPVYGSGPDGYRFELTRRAMPHLIREERLISAHNLALMLLVETGLIGFVLFFTGLGLAVKAAWRARHQSCGLLPLALLLPLVIAGFVVSQPSHHLVFWLATAYALAGRA